MKDRIGFVYAIRLSTGLYKIGRTKNLKQRHSTFRTIDPGAKRIVVALVNDYVKCEREVLKRLKGKGAGAKELFNLEPSDLRLIENYLEKHKTTDRRLEGFRVL